MKYGFVSLKTQNEFLSSIFQKIGNTELDSVIVGYDGEFSDFLKKKDFSAVSVGDELGTKVLEYMDVTDDHALEIGAVDTVVNKGGQLYGFNTSFGGFCGLIAFFGIEIKGKAVLVVGKSAIEKSVKAACVSLGAKKVCSDRDDYSDAEILINAGNDVDFDLSKCKKIECVIDTNAYPIRTELVRDALSRHISAYGGLYMLVRSAVLSYEIFSGEKVRYGETERIYSELLHSNENIVLIGMPGCGKSVVGTTVASMMGRIFIDVDTKIEEKYGSISYLMKEKGENLFRDIEEKVILEVSKKTGVVIAVGGGAVTRPCNIDALKANGKVFFIDRSPELISPSPKEPLSSSRLALMALFGQRYSVYRDLADIKIDGDESIKDVADTIVLKFRRFGEDGKIKLLVINGPNINLLGIREPDIYGRETYSDLCRRIEEHAERRGVKLEIYQSNHEGDIVDKIQQSLGNVDGIIINPAAYTHTSIAIPDAIKGVGIPTIEVHLSHVDEREEYRRVNFIREACFDVIAGKGGDGYIEAIDKMVKKFEID